MLKTNLATVPMTNEFELLSPTELSEQWDDYVLHHPKGSIFHTLGMQRVFEKTRQNEPWWQAATNQDGNIIAMLTAVRVETVGGLASRFASRSIWFSEPICDDTEEGKEALRALIEAHDQAMRGQILFCEVRPLFAQSSEFQPLVDCGYQYKDYLNYVVDLKDKADLESRVSKSCRKQIRKCAKRGVEIEVVTNYDSIEKMYELVQFSYERSKVPLVDVEIFHNALETLGKEVVEVRLAKLDGSVVAAGITLKFKDVVYAWYGGALRVTGLAPFAALTWHEIESGSNEGFGFYDFGGAGWPDEDYGPRDFKSKFGGELVQYGRYRKIDSAWKLTVATQAFSVVKKIKSILGSN